MIFTNVSRLGDFLLLLPVASWYYKKYNEKIHWVLSDNFSLYHKIEPLLLLQELTEKVSYVDVGTDAGNPNHWNFDPEQFGIDGDYFNFGFWGSIREYFPQFYARRYDLGVDNDFVINLGIPNIKESYSVWIESSPYRNEFGKLRSIIPTNCKELKSDFISDALHAQSATEVFCTMGGFAIILDLCNIKCNIYATPEMINDAFIYYRNPHNFRILN